MRSCVNLAPDGAQATVPASRCPNSQVNLLMAGPPAETFGCTGAILLLGDDAGYSITSNRVTGVDASAVSITGGFSYDTNGGGDVSQNAFKHNRRGINVTDAAGTITAHLNILVGNTSGGSSDSPNAAIRNVTNATVSASNNYCGAMAGRGLMAAMRCSATSTPTRSWC